MHDLLAKALARRADLRGPAKIGVIGAGFMGAAFVRQVARAWPHMRVAAIAARRPQQAIDAFAAAGRDATIPCDRADALEDAIAAGHAAI